MRPSPIGRCATCQRAFCASHQAWSGQNYYIDMCAPCFAKTPEGVGLARMKKEKAELRAAEDYFMYGAARTALLTAGVPPVKIYLVKRRSKPSFFGYKEVEEVTHLTYTVMGTLGLKCSTPGYSVSSSQDTSLTMILRQSMRNG